MSNVRDVDQMLQAAQRQSQAEQMLHDALKMALDRPHTVTTHRVHMSGVKHEDGAVSLAFGLPDGSRLEFEMNDGTASHLASELLVRKAEAA